MDDSSTSSAALTDAPHIHCRHTDEMFSKHRFMAGLYTQDDAHDLDLSVVRDYCLALSLQSLEALAPVP